VNASRSTFTPLRSSAATVWIRAESGFPCVSSVSSAVPSTAITVRPFSGARTRSMAA